MGRQYSWWGVERYDRRRRGAMPEASSTMAC
jgi:hypothetical protein